MISQMKPEYQRTYYQDDSKFDSNTGLRTLGYTGTINEVKRYDDGVELSVSLGKSFVRINLMRLVANEFSKDMDCELDELGGRKVSVLLNRSEGIARIGKLGNFKLNIETRKRK